MSLPFCSHFSVLVSVRSVGRCVLVIPALLLAITLQAEPAKKVESRKEKVEDAEADAAAALKPPVARGDVVHDSYFGETVDDPYRWMENEKDPGWLAFLKAQNDYTRALLDKLPGRDALL